MSTQRNQWVRARDVRAPFSARRKKKHRSIADRSRDHIKEVIRGEAGIQWNKQMGCNREFFIAWIESQFQPGMTWENRGSVWNIDHKRPCAMFDLLHPEQRRQCNHWSNLQPMWKKDNQSKSDKVTRPKHPMALTYVASDPREHSSQRVGVPVSAFWGKMKFTTTFGSWLDGSHQILLDTLPLHPNRLAAVGIAGAILEGVLETLCAACGFRAATKWRGLWSMNAKLARRGVYSEQIEMEIAQLANIRDWATLGSPPHPNAVAQMAKGVRAFLDYCCTNPKARRLLSGGKIARPRRRQKENIYEHMARTMDRVWEAAK